MQRPDPEFRLTLFGAFRLERAGEPIDLPRRKVESLLAYLVLHPEPHAREQLAALFWGDAPDDSARASLRNALTILRKTLDDDLLVTTRDTVQLNPEFPLWVDTKEFILHPSLFHLYFGDLLADFYDDWILPLRERYRKLCTEALLRETETQRSQSEYAGAIEFAERALAIDPANERAHQHLMFCHIAVGE